MACIPCETQSVTSVASFVARVARAVVVLAAALVAPDFVFAILVAYALALVIDVLIDTLADVLDEVITSDKPSSWAAFDSSTDATFDRAHSLQARMPSDHVCSWFESTALPHFPNQDPPRLQQLLLPDFLMIPHLEHTGIVSGILAAGVQMSMLVEYKCKDIHAATQPSICVVWIKYTSTCHINLELTFTGLHALNPLVIHLPIAGTPAVLKPGTTRSATACYTGSLENAALRARHRFDARHTDWRGDWCPGYQISFR